MTVYLGTDIVYIPRIQAALDRFGQRFLLRVYTRAEQQHCLALANQPRTTATRCAGRWAAKEAIAKALGTGWRGISYTEIEIQNLPSGAPHVCLYGKAAEIAANWGNCCWQVSISHDGDYSQATAIVLCQPFTNTATTTPASISPLPCV
ncbi:MAG TPA: holo-ACP synthase [Halomicronema sp.]